MAASSVAPLASRSARGGARRVLRNARVGSGGRPARRPSQIIDVHHHLIPPFYLEAYRDRIAGSRGGVLSEAWQTWSPERAIEAMDACDVVVAMLSLSTPGVWFGDVAEARDIARRTNDYAAALQGDHPRRFGLLAALPLPDIDASLREIRYAVEDLKVDGLGLLTSYGEVWLGDPRFAPLFDEINRLGATVFVHPTTPPSCRSLLPGIPPLIAEVPQDTTRAIMSLLFSGAFARWPRIRFIFSHAGGTIPMVANRLEQYQPPQTAENVPDGILHALRGLYYDLAGTAVVPAVAALMSLVPPTQIVFGSDNPYIPLAETVDGLARLPLTSTVKRLIANRNARGLFPRLAQLVDEI